MQQHLPFTVLKHIHRPRLALLGTVATALTVYGIETFNSLHNAVTADSVATALTVYGIETTANAKHYTLLLSVATALTVYGIETPVGCLGLVRNS